MFTPSKGYWSEEDFSSESGFSPTDSTKQGVTGGVGTLLPSNPISTGYFHKWSVVTGWTVNNGLNTQGVVESDFNVVTQDVGPQYNGSPTGYQKVASDGGSWEVFTPFPSGSGQNVSGQQAAWFSLDDTSPNSSFYDSLSGSVTPFTIEVDVASTIKVGDDTLSGIPSGNLSSRSPITGDLNHGIYISNGPNWDYIEVRPDGIRSRNHPELYLPADLRQPKRFRIGVDSQDIYLLSEDGYGVIGLGKFDGTGDPTNKPMVAFGAPYTGADFRFPVNDVVSFIGNSFWSSVKVLTGKLSLDIPTGAQSYYSTASEVMYTPDFDAGIPLSEWSFARINYIPYRGGTTSVGIQYRAKDSSDQPVWVDGPSVTIPTTGSAAYLDISSVPASVPVPLTGVSGSAYHSLPKSQVRFKITQSSTAGTDLPPAIDSIYIQGSRHEPLLDMSPGWKPSIKSGDINLFILTGRFKNSKPDPRSDSVVFVEPATRPGTVAAGDILDLSPYRRTGAIVGSGEVVPGKYDRAFQTYYPYEVVAATGTPARDVFGQKSVENVIPDPGFDSPFKDVSTDPRYVAGFSKGEIGFNTQLSAGYTGGAQIVFSKEPVVKAGPAATNYAQKVDLKGTAPDWEQGLEVLIPSGILVSGKVGTFSVSVRSEDGGGIAIVGTGSVSIPRTVVPVSGSDFQTISVDASITDSGDAYIGIFAESGTSTSFEFDDVYFAHTETGYITYPSVSLPRTLFGNIGTAYADWVTQGPPPAQAYRACTIATMDLYLESYPSSPGVLMSLEDNGTGLSITIDSNGNLVADFDVSHNAVYESGYTGTFASIFNLGQPDSDKYLGNFKLTGNAQVPVGRWVNIGFIHESHACRRFGGRGASGQIINGTLAATNRAYLTIDGMPVASIDTLPNWTEQAYKAGIFDENQNLLFEVTGAAVVPTFVTNVTGTLTVLSGVVGKGENIHLARPPVADAEAALYIDSARVGVPYFKPDLYLKPGSDEQISTGVLVNKGVNTGTLSPGTHVQSLWPLDNPGPYTNWDHGSNRNHLLFYGNVTKNTGINPYDTGFSSTRFSEGTGNYGIASYSSTLDRLINPRETWTGVTPLSRVGTGQVSFGGWVYPETTGKFFEFVIDDTDPDTEKISLEIYDTTTVRLTRYDSAGAEVWAHSVSHTGTLISGWHHVGADLWYSPYTTLNQFGNSTGTFYFNGSGSNFSFTSLAAGGFDYRGNVEDSESSAVFLGRGFQGSLVDCFIVADTYDEGPVVDWTGVASPSLSKGGDSDRIYYNGVRVTGVTISGFNRAIAHLPPTSGGTVKSHLWAGTNLYAIDEAEHLSNFEIHAAHAFVEALAYVYKYDVSPIDMTFGRTDSPIRIGLTVPPHAVPLARVDFPNFSVDNAISTINLADDTPENLTAFRRGNFTLSADSISIAPSSISSFKNINSGMFSGAADVTYSEQVDTRDIRVTSLAVPSRELDETSEAFYVYLVGRGEWAVNVLGAHPHPETGELYTHTTGSIVDNYMSNLEKIKSSISLSYGDGSPADDILWDIVVSPYTPENLDSAIENSQDIFLDGVLPSGYAGTHFSGMLPDGNFMVVLVSPHIPNDGRTVWVKYQGYNISDGTLDPNRKEVYNPVVAIREEGAPTSYSVSLDSNNANTYSVTIYGVDASVTGNMGS
ncbi:MAG: hypothetical protein D6698_08975 [Gammaproteobacteria bacterium]|nr:MAG: hypothetical protein D6698_08975 [Gammaproteobacteria bacterium]